MADDGLRLTIRLDGSLGDLLTFSELMREEDVQVVSAAKATAEQDPAAPRRSNRPFVIGLQGSEPAIEAAMALFRQWLDARGDSVEIEVVGRDVLVEQLLATSESGP